MNKTNTQQQRGFTLLLAIMVSGIVVAIGMSLLSISLKQFKIASILHDSETAFQVANAGVECMRYWDIAGEAGGKEGGYFDVGAPSSMIECFGESRNAGGASNGQEQNFEFAWTNSGSGIEVCTDVSIYKFFDAANPTSMSSIGVPGTCPAGVECTVIQSRG